MQELVQNFQKQLKHKLQYKASSKISPDTFLYKSFKFFDLYNNGYLSKSDFFKAIAKCGVVVDTHDMQAIYNHYDTHHDGNIHYKEFIQSLLFSSTQQNSLRMSQSQLTHNKKPQQTNPQYRNNQDIQFGKKSRSSQIHHQNLKQSNINRIYQDCQNYSEVVESVKRQLRQKGLTSLINFAVELKTTDSKKTHKINKAQLKSRLPFLSDKAINFIIRQFTDGKNEQINYAEFIYSLKGQLQTEQQSIIDRAFEFLDVRNQREVEIQRVVHNFKNFNYKSQFVAAVNLYENFQGIDDGIFTDEDFLDFFGFLAFSFYDSQQFIIFIEKAFFDTDNQSQHSQRSNRSRQFKRESGEGFGQKSQYYHNTNADFRKNKQESFQPHNQLKNSDKHKNEKNQLSGQKAISSRRSERSQADKKSSTTSCYVKQVEMIVLRMKKRLASKGTKGYLVFQKSLKQVDSDEDGLINLDQFKKVIKDQKIDITNNQSNLMFDVFDPDSTNLISYSELIQTLKGEMPEKRKQYFERVWNTVKLNDQYTTFSNLKHALNFRGHPDIQTGRRYDDQILKQIHQTILLIQELNEMPRNQNISKKQFYEYFENLSLSISQDQLFESILNNFWKMQSKTNINQMYAGSRKLFDPSKKSYLMDHHRYAVKGGSISSNAPYGTSNQPTSYFTQHQKL